MNSTRLAAYLQARGVHYGWVVVAITFLIMLATAGAMGASGVILEPLQREFGWTTAEISVALAIRLMLFGLMGPFAAALINRFGVRHVVAFAVGADRRLASLADGDAQVWQLMLLWGVVVGIGTGMTALVLGATVATRWFAARRGLVVGMLDGERRDRAIGVPAAARQPSPSDMDGWTRMALICAVARR